MGCLYLARYDGPYHGKVVDQETRTPLEGVVVLGTWSVSHFDPGGGSSTYYDAHEVVTDKNGEFVIPGLGLRMLSSIKPMDFTVFKAGYSYFSSNWNSLKIETRKDIIKWDGEMPIIPVRKLSDEDKIMWHGAPDPPSEASFEDVKFMLREIDKDRKTRGLNVRGFWGGRKYE